MKAQIFSASMENPQFPVFAFEEAKEVEEEEEEWKEEKRGEYETGQEDEWIRKKVEERMRLLMHKEKPSTSLPSPSLRSRQLSLSSSLSSL